MNQNDILPILRNLIESEEVVFFPTTSQKSLFAQPECMNQLTLTALFTKPSTLCFLAVPWFRLVQFLWNRKVSIDCQWKLPVGTASGRCSSWQFFWERPWWIALLTSKQLHVDCNFFAFKTFWQQNHNFRWTMIQIHETDSFGYIVSNHYQMCKHFSDTSFLRTKVRIFMATSWRHVFGKNTVEFNYFTQIGSSDHLNNDKVLYVWCYRYL